MLFFKKCNKTKNHEDKAVIIKPDDGYLKLTVIKHPEEFFNLDNQNINNSSKSFQNDSSMNDDSYNRFIEGSELFEADAVYNVHGTRSDSEFLQGDHSEESRSQSQYDEDEEEESQKNETESNDKDQSYDEENEIYDYQKLGNDSGVYEYQYGSNSKSNGDCEDIRDNPRKNSQSLFSPEFEKRLSEIKTSNFDL